MLDFMEDIDHEGGAKHKKVETHEIEEINHLLSTAEVQVEPLPSDVSSTEM